MLLNCFIMNTKLNLIKTAKFPFKPSVGDKLPLNHIKERVTDVVIVTPLVVKSMNLTGDFNLVIFTE